MATVNIGKDNAGDAFYRYKMPRLATKIEGRGNGIKTNIMNNVDIAKALDRPPQYVVKYFGCELGAQTNFDDKTGTSIVNGAHQTTTISELLEGFIKKFVQCYSCGNPETVVKIDKRDNITLKCKACGASSDVDPRHKLCTYILKNPPEPKMSKAEKKIRKKMAEAVGEDPAMDDEEGGGGRSKSKKDKKDKKEKKEKKDKKDKKDKKRAGSDEDTTEAEAKEEAGSPDVEDDDDDDDTEWMTDTSAAAVAARVQEQLSSQTAAMVTIGNLEEEEEARKKAKKEAKRAKKAEKEARAKLQNTSIEDDDEDEDEDDDDDDIDIPALRKYILSRTPEDAVKALTKMEVPGGTMGTLRLLWQVVFGGDNEPLSGKIGDNKEFLLAFLEDANSQLALLGGLEYFVTVSDPSQLRETSKVLKALYDMDIAEEEVILAWAKKASIAEPLGVKPEQAAECRAAAKPVIDWLEEADEESDDEA